MFSKHHRGDTGRDTLPVGKGREKLREDDGELVSRHGSDAQFRELDADVSTETTTQETDATVETSAQSSAAESSTTPTSLGMGDLGRLLEDVTDATDVNSARGIDGEQGLTTIARGEVVRVTRPLVDQSHVETASGVTAVVANTALEVDPNLRFGGPRAPSAADRANRLLDRELGLGRRDNGLGREPHQASSTRKSRIGAGDIGRLTREVNTSIGVLAIGTVVEITMGADKRGEQFHVKVWSMQGAETCVAAADVEIDHSLKPGGNGQGTPGSSMQHGRPRVGYTKADVDRTIALLMEKYAYRNMPGSASGGADADLPGGYIPKTRHIIAMLDHGAIPELIFKMWDDFVAKFSGETLHERAFDAYMFNHDGSQEIYMQWLHGWTPGA